MSKFPPTPQQQAVLDAPDDVNLVVEAGAGTGKTATLRLRAEAKPQAKTLYLAYNKAIQLEAAASFPGNVTCKTAHSLAFGAVGRQYAKRLNSSRIPAWKAAQILGITGTRTIADVELTKEHQARLAMNTVRRFCHSADAQIGQRHVERINGLEEHHQELASLILPLAEKAWHDITQTSGQLKFEHDHYLKIWQLSGPRLPYDVILFDEAQDANPVIADIVTRQKHAQIIMVGDRNQAIYGWNGAVDAMSGWDGQRYIISQSFRFGQAIADTANLFLDQLDAELRLQGFERINSSVEDIQGAPDAVLCRTNGAALWEAMRYLSEGFKVALVGGGDNLRRLAQAAVTLMAGQGTSHPELFAFKTWGEVQQYVAEDEGGSDLKVFVKLIDQLGAEMLIEAIDSLTTDETKADVIISTAHKAKGREWDRVRIAGDFPQPTEERPVSQAELMLAYVAVTRAKLVLDLGGLTWITES